MAKTKHVENADAEGDAGLEDIDDAPAGIEDDDPDIDEADIDEADIDEADIDEAEVDVDDVDALEIDGDLDDGEALDELEAEELEMLTDDEAAETIVVDEAAEMRALRREELALDVDPEAASADEFVCQSCFLVKRMSQLADKRKKICADCAS